MTATNNNTTRHKWVSVPDLDHKAQVAASRAQGKIAAILRERRAHVALIHLENLKEPPRRTAISYWSYRENGYHDLTNGREIPQNVVELDIGIDMVPIAIDLYRRWPDKERPLAIALISDGCRLLFNPGRPDRDPAEILRAHHAGTAPAAMLLSPRDNRGSHLSKVFGA